MHQEHHTALQPGMALRSSGDFDLMWREMAHTAQDVWSIAHAPLPELFTIWEPRCALVEQEDAYHLQAQLPGMQREDVRIAYEGGMLLLHGERTIVAARTAALPRTTYGSQAFTRRFMLAAPVDIAAMVITYHADTLDIWLPKATASEVASTDAVSHFEDDAAHNDRMAVLAS